ncbi:hypothetical protein KA078_01200 [Candidatus Woesebacteria bacterium]|nr:hypothetical protein [Candidatus Woesebacteria bacterium]
MTEQDTLPQQLQSTAPQVSIFSRILLTLLLLALCGGSFYAGKMMSAQKSQSPETPPALLGSPVDTTTGTSTVNSTAPFSEVSEKGPQAYPVVDDNKLIWVSLKNPQEQSSSYTKESSDSGGGALGFGNHPFLRAPDLLKIAYINSENQLEIISSDGSVVKPVPELPIQYLTSWSKDSKKLLVYVTPQTIQTVLNPEGMSSTNPSQITHDLSKFNIVGGYYLIDLTTKVTKYLSMLTGVGVVDFIDNSKLLISMSRYDNKENYATFDVETYLFDPTKLFDSFIDYTWPQFSTSADGSVWAMTLTQGQTMHSENAEAAIVVGKFPTVPTTIVKKGAYAQYQGPLVSPKGTKVIFRAYDVLNGPKYIHLYQDGKDERLVEALPEMWVNDTQFVYSKYFDSYTSQSNLQNVSLYDTQTKQSTLLYEYSKKESE